jgi:hypothetical protein
MLAAPGNALSSVRTKSEQLIAHIRGRVEQCRRLAKMIGNEEARRTLLQMADEGDADIRRLEAQQDQASKS